MRSSPWRRAARRGLGIVFIGAAVAKILTPDATKVALLYTGLTAFEPGLVVTLVVGWELLLGALLVCDVRGMYVSLALATTGGAMLQFHLLGSSRSCGCFGLPLPLGLELALSGLVVLATFVVAAGDLVDRSQGRQNRRTAAVPLMALLGGLSVLFVLGGEAHGGQPSVLEPLDPVRARAALPPGREVSLRIRNRSTEQVELREVLPSCECVTVRRFPRVLRPGQMGALVVRVDPERLDGREWVGVFVLGAGARAGSFVQDLRVLTE
ncbi:MAG: hypothetical protein MUE73_20320 [Planctomycetes bacterium]|jgi:hypothetical protein|nr:hypothetical protein [Planctomycetota bacterium]